MASTPSPRRVTIESRSSSVSAPSVDVGDQQPGRVRADVDDRDARVTRPGAASGGRRARRGGCRPPSSAIFARVRTVAEPMCGTTSRFGASSSGWSGGSGSGSVTSSAAPAIVPSCSARRSASWSTTPPRAVLTSSAVGFIALERVASIRCAGLRRQRRVERDEVGAREQLVERHAGRARAVDDVHAEALGAARDRLADAAAADDPERRAGELGAEAAGRLPRPPLAARAPSRGARQIRRASASSSANARSAVASVSTSGVLPTGMPRAAAASRSMLSVPTAMFAIACRRGRGVEQRGVDAVGEQRQQALGLGDARRAARPAPAAGRPATRRPRARRAAGRAPRTAARG